MARRRPRCSEEREKHSMVEGGSRVIRAMSAEGWVGGWGGGRLQNTRLKVAVVCTGMVVRPDSSLFFIVFCSVLIFPIRISLL